MSEHDSEKWTGEPAKKLDPVSMGAGAAIATGVLCWAAFWGINREAFGANIMTELFGIVIEVGLVILGVDWLTNRRARKTFSDGIGELNLKLQQQAPRCAQQALDCLATFVRQDPANTDRFTGTRSRAVAYLNQRIPELQRLHDDYRVEIQHAPEMGAAIRRMTQQLTTLRTELQLLPADTVIKTEHALSATMTITSTTRMFRTTRDLLNETMTGDEGWDSWASTLLIMLGDLENSFNTWTKENPIPGVKPITSWTETPPA